MATDTNPTTTRQNRPDVTFRYPTSADESACESVYTAIATAEECSMLDLDPLGETIDTDALNSLFSSGRGHGRSQLTFRYHGYTVTVTENEIAVLPDS